jgi:hypothetical protein
MRRFAHARRGGCAPASQRAIFQAAEARASPLGCSNLLALAGSLPKDKEKLLARIRAVRAGEAPGLRPKWLRRGL